MKAHSETPVMMMSMAFILEMGQASMKLLADAKTPEERQKFETVINTVFDQAISVIKQHRDKYHYVHFCTCCRSSYACGECECAEAERKAGKCEDCEKHCP